MATARCAGVASHQRSTSITVMCFSLPMILFPPGGCRGWASAPSPSSFPRLTLEPWRGRGPFNATLKPQGRPACLGSCPNITFNFPRTLGGSTSLLCSPTASKKWHICLPITQEPFSLQGIPLHFLPSPSSPAAGGSAHLHSSLPLEQLSLVSCALELGYKSLRGTEKTSLSSYILLSVPCFVIRAASLNGRV